MAKQKLKGKIKVSKEERKLLDSLNTDLRDLHFGGLFEGYLEKKFSKGYEKSIDRAIIKINKWQKKFEEVL